MFWLINLAAGVYESVPAEDKRGGEAKKEKKVINLNSILLSFFVC